MDFKKALLSTTRERAGKRNDVIVLGDESLWPVLGKIPVQDVPPPPSTVPPPPSTLPQLPTPPPLPISTPFDSGTQLEPNYLGPSSPIRSPSPPLLPPKRSQPPKNQPSSRRPPRLITFDIQAALQASPRQSKAKRSNGLKKPLKKLHPKGRLCGNRLDSDSPKRKKGKEREVPKKKRLSFFKKALLSEREEEAKSEEGVRKRSLRAAIANDLSLREICHALKPGLIPNEKKDISPHVDKTEFHPPEGTDSPLPAVPTLTPHQIAEHLVHNKHLREYCHNLVDDELRLCAKQLMSSLKMFHDRLYHKDPFKAQSKKRYVAGFKETKRQLCSQSAQLVFIATDLNIKPGHDLYKIINELKHTCDEMGIPCIFADGGSAMARWIHIWKGKVSFIAILNYQGAEDIYKKLILLWKQRKEAYSNKIKEVIQVVSKHDSAPGDSERDILCASMIEKLTC